MVQVLTKVDDSTMLNFSECSVVVKAKNPKAKAWTPPAAKTKDTNLCPGGSSGPRPVLENYITE